jgi:hypothetical protein
MLLGMADATVAELARSAETACRCLRCNDEVRLRRHLAEVSEKPYPRS